jgi:hypothetical protein
MFDYDKDFIVNYNFNINGYAKRLGDEIYINLNLNKELTPYKMDEDRKNEIEYEYKSHFNYTTTFNIPEGYSVDYIPENVSVSNNLVSSNISYSKNDKTITYKHDATFNFINLSLAEQKTLNNTVKTINKAYKEVIVLKKI